MFKIWNRKSYAPFPIVCNCGNSWQSFYLKKIQKIGEICEIIFFFSIYISKNGQKICHKKIIDPCIHLSCIIQGLFHLEMWPAQCWVVTGLRGGLFPSVTGCSHRGIHQSIRHMCSSLWMLFKRQWTIPNVEATCDHLSHLRNGLKYFHNVTMCKVKP
jgi:hypothetical protein